jgi:hypothetical protein
MHETKLEDILKAQNKEEGYLEKIITNNSRINI